VELDAELDHRHTYASYSDFMLRTMRGLRRLLKPNGVGVLVIGDVQTPNRPTVDLAEQIWNDVGAAAGLDLLDLIEDDLDGHNSKVSRIWGETRGNATDRDCILIVTRQGAEPVIRDGEADWDEPYKEEVVLTQFTYGYGKGDWRREIWLLGHQMIERSPTLA
jgi:hypothetical protein